MSDTSHPSPVQNLPHSPQGNEPHGGGNDNGKSGAEKHCQHCERYCRIACSVLNALWKRRPDATQLLAIGTIALAVIAYFALRESQDTARRQLRAYMYLNTGPAFHVDGQGVLQVYSTVGNSGQTVALKVERFVGLEILPTEDSISDQMMFREPGIGILGPRAELTIVKNWRSGALAPDQEPTIRASNLKIYVFGKILYDDIYGIPWEMRFCNVYFGSEGFLFPQATDANPKNTSFGYVGWQARPCEGNNKIEERK
jgi:hypothetical protein